MHTFDTVTALRREFEPARRRLEQCLAYFTDSQMIAPLLAGGWSVKDVLAHVAFWDDRLVYAVHPPLGALNPLAPPAIEDIPRGSEWLEEVNARVYQLNQTRSLADVRNDFEQAYARLYEVVCAVSDHDLIAADGLSGRWGFSAMEMFSGIHEHYEEHALALETVLKSK